MQPQNRIRFFMPILLMDALVIVFLRPVRFPGFVVMNTLTIVTLLIALHVTDRKRTV